jgi:hypothetical protein
MKMKYVLQPRNLRRVRHSRMPLAGIQAEFGLDPRLKHSGVTALWNRISSPQPQFLKEQQVKRFRFARVQGPEIFDLPVYPAVDINLVAFVLRDVERIAIRIEAAVLRHGTVARSLADAAFRQCV